MRTRRCSRRSRPGVCSGRALTRCRRTSSSTMRPCRRSPSGNRRHSASSPASRASARRSSSATGRMCSVSSPLEKGQRLVELHAGEPFVIPNPWDVGSARELEALGFPALATTSSGFAWTLGKQDGEATLDEVVEHVRAIAAAVSIPLSVDLENGYGPPEIAIRRVAEAGAQGGSIEDWNPDGAIYARGEAVERMAAAVAAAPDD